MSSGNANYQKYNGGPTPVKRYQANSLGLHDMSGNVWEWVQDKYAGYGSVGKDNPIYENYGTTRGIRGGGWRSVPRDMRCSRRYEDVPAYRAGFMGFRLVRLR